MKELMDKINNDIKKIKVTDYKEETVATDANFLSIKKGYYQLNNGQTIIRESVTKKAGTGNAVCVFAVTEDKKIIVVVQPRVTLDTVVKVNVEIPAGYKEVGESAVETALRELVEETGYSSNNAVLVDTYYPSLGASGEKIELILALNCVKIGDQKLDSDEFVFYEIITLKEFEYLLNNNYIMDAHARIGYYRYLEYLMKEGS